MRFSLINRFLGIAFIVLALQSASAEMKPISTSILSQIEGTWEALGYGKFLQVSGGQLREYHKNDYGCIDTADQSQTQLLLDYAYIDIIDANSFFASPAPFGNRWLFIRSAPLTGCRSRSDADALTTFDFFDSYMRQHFAYFAERGIDWNTRSQAARSTLTRNASDRQLYNAIQGLLTELGDPHTGLYAVLDGELVHPLSIYPRHAMPLIRTTRTSPSQTDDDLFLDWIIGQLSGLETRMMQVGKVIQTTPFYWAKFENIGYLHIGSEGGFAISGKLSDEIAGLESALDRALTDLANSDAIIVDLSLNLGGYEWLSQTIARRFAAEPILVHQKTLHDAPAIPPLDYIVEPSNRVSYHGPLYLLTSDITVSAGEDLTLSLRALPQTRHYGLNTYGALSNILTKPLPNGWGLTLSNEIFTDADGAVWEATGIDPDFEYDLYQDGIRQSHYDRIQAFVAHIKTQRQYSPHLQINLEGQPTLLVDQAEPGSTLALQASSDLLQWTELVQWQYDSPAELDLEPSDLGSAIFFRIKEIY